METNGYIDIHSHILPGVDDGARNMEESIKMLKVAYEQGIRTMYTTPHYGSGKEKYKNSSRLIECFEQLKEQAADVGEEGIELILGNELYYTHSLIDALDTGKAYTMGGTRYVLVEFNFGIDYKELYKGLQQLINAGYRPILAHIERYYCLFRHFSELSALKELGVSLQVNSCSLSAKLSSEALFCRKVIREGYIDFLGSDCHQLKWRPPVMKDCVHMIEKKTPEKYLNRILYKNPAKLRSNEFI